MSDSAQPRIVLHQKVAVAFLAPAVVVCVALLSVPGYVREGGWRVLFLGMTCGLLAAIPLVLFAPRPPRWVTVGVVLLSDVVIVGMTAAVETAFSAYGFALFSLPTTYAALFFSRRVLLYVQGPATVVGLVLSFVVVGERGPLLVLHTGLALCALLTPAVALIAIRVRLDDALTRERAIAATDPLTGLANRRGLAARAAVLVGHAQRMDVDVCVITVDLDHFKRVNDTAGHHTGDDVLRTVSQTLLTSTRALDICARMGGEEFVVLVAMPADEALGLAERLREQVAANCAEVAVTASLGMAYAPAPGAGRDVEAFLWGLVDRADDFMYVAKRMGRNRVVSAPLPAAAPRHSETTICDPAPRIAWGNSR